MKIIINFIYLIFINNNNGNYNKEINMIENNEQNDNKEQSKIENNDQNNKSEPLIEKYDEKEPMIEKIII